MTNPMPWLAKKVNDLGFDLYEQQSFIGINHHNINGQPVVVSVAQQSSKSGGYLRWQWKVTFPNRKNKFVVILIAVDDKGQCYAYILPWEVAQNRTRYEINSHPSQHTGALSRHLDNWLAIYDAIVDREPMR